MVTRLKQRIDDGVKTRKMRNRWISMDAWEDVDSMKRMSCMIRGEKWVN